jgi:hypothetical protein
MNALVGSAPVTLQVNAVTHPSGGNSGGSPRPRRASCLHGPASISDANYGRGRQLRRDTVGELSQDLSFGWTPESQRQTPFQEIDPSARELP